MSIDVDLVRNSLEKVFPPLPLAPTSDEMGEYLSAREFSQYATGKTWPELETAFLERHHDALFFFEKKSVVSYLPAYLVALVRREPVLNALPLFTLDLLTRENTAKFDARFSSLSIAQRRAIANVLALYEQDVLGTGWQADVTRALDSYWRNLIGDDR